MNKPGNRHGRSLTAVDPGSYQGLDRSVGQNAGLPRNTHGGARRDAFHFFQSGMSLSLFRSHISRAGPWSSRRCPCPTSS
ncbi:hypothetical protein FRAHR75_150040 [Frankia sp. Hr75.2]|nr:hypothetical protein FRAHR75_150040 [Frankia sp. Hr75.2]